MDADPTGSGLIILASLIASAFFSGMEIAFVSSNRLQLELDAQQTRRGRMVAYLTSRPQWLITTLLVGNNLALVFCGMEAGSWISRSLFHVDDWMLAPQPLLALITQTAITTGVVLVVAEFLPKSIFHGQPNRWLRDFAPILFIIHHILLIPGLIVVGISQGLIWLTGQRKRTPETSRQNLGAVDLDHFIRQISGRMHPEQELEHELQIMQNALEFNKVRARDCLIPRNEVVAVDIETDLSALLNLFIETGLSKIVVYKGDIDSIVGYVHSKDLFKRPDSLKSILLPTLIIPEPMHADEVLKRFMQRRRHLAVVVDEFGGTSGILTMEDIVEQLIGEIDDEFDVEERIVENLGKGTWRLSARLTVSEINQMCGCELPLDDAYETLGGLVLHHAEEIPAEGFTFPLRDAIIEIESVDQNRIHLIKLQVLHPTGE
jgi:CBS domain containing-hemolysin-like protein